MSVPCCEHLLRYVWVTFRWPSGCPWCGLPVKTHRSGRYYPHRDLDEDGPIRRWAHECRGSGRHPTEWRPDVVTVRPSPDVL